MMRLITAFVYDSKTAEQSERLLRSVAITGNYHGYWYLVCAADLVLEDPTRLHLITKRLYRDIAQIYKTTPGAVERGIRTAIQSGWERGSKAAFESLMGYLPKECPSNAEFIDSIVHNLRYR